jgi:hypothetical protein
MREIVPSERTKCRSSSVSPLKYGQLLSARILQFLLGNTIYIDFRIEGNVLFLSTFQALPRLRFNVADAVYNPLIARILHRHQGF